MSNSLRGFLNMWYLGKKLILVGCVCGLVFIGDFQGTVALGQAAVEETDELERSEIVGSLVEPFIRALQLGDIAMLEQCIDGKLSIMIGKLLRRNKEYPNFLRAQYGGSSLRDSIKVFRNNGLRSGLSYEEGGTTSGLRGGTGKTTGRTAVVYMNRSDGTPENFSLSIERDKQGNWKIVDKR